MSTPTLDHDNTDNKVVSITSVIEKSGDTPDALPSNVIPMSIAPQNNVLELGNDDAPIVVPDSLPASYNNAAANVDTMVPGLALTSPSAPAGNYVLEQLGNIHGLRILELGGPENAVYLAQQGAQVTSVYSDLFGYGICRDLAEKHNTNVNAVVANSEKLPFNDGSFDCVVINRQLYKTSIVATLLELKRILKPSGKAWIIEPLPYNPIFSQYRYKGNDAPSDKPMNSDDLEKVRAVFPHIKIKGFGLTSAWGYMKMARDENLDPKKVNFLRSRLLDGVSTSPQFTPLFETLQKIDNFLLKTLPFLQKVSETMVIEVQASSMPLK